MSFVRIRRPHSASGYPRKKKSLKKPVWDDTIHDLTQLKATPEEIEDRKERHRSKHAVGVRLSGQNNGGSKNLSIASHDARQLAIMKEVLYNQQQFQNVLAKSDKMMSVVNDLFGDDPKRYTGIPHITTAPGGEDAERSGDIVAPLPDIQTRIEALSESIMDGSALNDFGETDSEEESPEPIVYEPKFNMARFQQFLQAEEKNQSMSTISGQAQLSQLDQGPVQSTQIQDTYTTQASENNTFETPKKDGDESISILRTPRSAINDTKKVRKSKKRVVQTQPEQQKPSNLNLTDLRKVLEHLEDEIADYERQTGRRPPAERQRQESFSGYTLSLVDSVTKLTRYLKESEMRLRAEMTVREQLTQDVFQLRALIDALTSDIILTQEEYGNLKTDYAKYKEQTQDELLRIKSTLLTAGLYHQPTDTTTQPNRPVPDIPDVSHTEDPPEHNMEEEEMSAVPDYMKTSSGAVLLSPPVRKTRIQRENEARAPMQQHLPMRQTSLVDLNTQDNNTHSSGVQNQEETHFQSLNNTSHNQRSGLPQYHGNSVPFKNIGQTLGQGQIRFPGNTQGHQIPQNMGPSQQRSHQVTHQPNQIPQSSVRSHIPPPAAAKVSVPRPSPLVQSNVGVSIQDNIDQSALKNAVPNSGMQQSNKDVLASQIAELNKQHEEAQKRLENLLKEHQQSNNNSDVSDDKENLPGHIYQSPPSHQQKGLAEYPVSPPISPISQQSDPYLSLQSLQNANIPTTRGITVSIPRAELELSAGSSPSPRH